MAIAYKSAGAGVATETSGAACSPASPATVDAGDILIIHAYYEGTTTAPGTPSGFTLLHGPVAVEAVGRHWIFGKIAAGTEDGAANAFGTAAVTTMRSGRCYSFSGRVSGTITDLVLGFASTTHATDPQMPTVTTTVAGAMAVACVAQNDNNTAGSATGESGGDWVEAVAEFVAALTPGLMLQLQTAAMANPGTISGGSVATTNDPCGVIGFEVRPSAPANVTVTPTTAALTTATFAPTVTATANVTATPTTASLTTATFAPTVTASDHKTVTPTTAALSLTSFAPTVTGGSGTTVTPSTASLTTATFAPTVSVTDHKTVTPSTASLSVSTFAPTVTATENVTVTPGTASLTLTVFAPTVTGGGSVGYVGPSRGGGASGSLRAYVDIDGQLVRVSSYEEAVRLLTELKEEEEAQEEDCKKCRILVKKYEVDLRTKPKQKSVHLESIERQMDERAERIAALYANILANLEVSNDDEEVLKL